MEIFLPFVSTFLGVFIAFLLGIWGQSAHNRHVNDLQRNETVKSILEELTSLHNRLLDVRKERAEEPKVFAMTDLINNAEMSAVASGRFALLDVDLQLRTSSVYSLVRRLENFQNIGDLRPEMWYQGRRLEIDWIMRKFDETLEKLLELIPPLIELLNKAPKPLSMWDHMMADVFG